MIIAIASTFTPYRGGIAQFNDRMAIALKENGHTVRCFNWHRQYPSFLFPGVSQTINNNPPPKSKSAPLDSIRPSSWRETAKEILNDGKVDVVILPFWHAALAPALRGVAKNIKRLSPTTQVIALMHNSSSHDSKMVDLWLTKRFLKSVDSCIVLSNSVKNQVNDLIPSLQIDVLFHPLYDHYPAPIEKRKAREELGIPSESNVALFFGLIRPYKGLSILLKSADSLSLNTHIIIAGECYGSWDTYQNLINATSSPERIHIFNRFIPNDEMGLIFGAADCVVLPYLKASQSGVTATALHYNLPIIASKVGDLPNTISEGITGLLVEPDSPSSLSSAINNWFSKPQHPEFNSKQLLLKSERSWKEFALQLVKVTQPHN